MEKESKEFGFFSELENIEDFMCHNEAGNELIFFL